MKKSCILMSLILSVLMTGCGGAISTRFHTLKYSREIMNMSNCKEGDLLYESFIVEYQDEKYLFVRVIPSKKLDRRIITLDVKIEHCKLPVSLTFDYFALSDTDDGCIILYPLSANEELKDLSDVYGEVNIEYVKAIGCK